MSTSQIPADAAPAPVAHRAFSFARVWAIASNTLLELIRLKVFYFLLLFALLLIGSSLWLVKMTFQEQFQVLKDLSLGAMSIFSWLLAVLATAMLLPKDLEDRTLYTILAKPVPRFEYLLGKLLGVFALLFVSLLAMTAFFLFILYFREQTVLADVRASTPPEQLADAVAEIKRSTFTFNLIPGIISIFVKAALCASLTLLLSTIATSWIFTILTSMMVYLIGHMQGVAREQWLEQATPSIFLKGFLMFVALFFPDLQIFSLVDDVAAGAIVSPLLFWRMLGLGGIYVVIYLGLGYFIFSKREL